MRSRDFWRFLSGPKVADLAAAARPEITDRGELASAARRLLEEPVFRVALERMQQRLFETWKQTSTADTPRREEMYRLHWAIEELRAELRRMRENARVPQGVHPQDEQ